MFLNSHSIVPLILPKDKHSAEARVIEAKIKTATNTYLTIVLEVMAMEKIGRIVVDELKSKFENGKLAENFVASNHVPYCITDNIVAPICRKLQRYV